MTPPSIHTGKVGGADVNVNVHLAAGDLKTPAPATMKVDNPGLAGAQNAPTVPSVNVQPINLPNRAADLHVQSTTVHTGNPGTTHLPDSQPSARQCRRARPWHGRCDPGGPARRAAPAAGTQASAPEPRHPHTPAYTTLATRWARAATSGTRAIGTNTIASRTEIPLPGLTDRPGAYVKVERTEGGVSSFSLYGGGPDGRMDVLAGGNLRFTDTATGQTTRFDSGGIAIDQGLRLTKTDGVLRPADHIMVVKNGEVRVTTLTGDAVPDVKIQQLDSGSVQLIDEKGVTFHYNAQGKLENQPLSAAWDQDLAAKAGVFRQPGDTDAMVNAKMADFGQVQRAQNHFDNALDNVAMHGHRADGPSTGPAVGDQVHIDLKSAEADLSAAKTVVRGQARPQRRRHPAAAGQPDPRLR